MSETANRIISGLLIAGLVIAALSLDLFYWISILLLVMIFSILGLLEFYKLSDRGYEGRPVRFLGIIFSILIVLSFYAQFLKTQHQHEQSWIPDIYHRFMDVFYPGQNLVPALLVVFLIVTMSVNLIFRPLDGTIYSISVTFTGVLYTCLTISHVFPILALKYGVFYFLLFATIPIFTDAGSYFVGRWFGKHNAGLKVSPKKTYEGYLGGFVTACLTSNILLWGWKIYAVPELRDISMGHAEVTVIAVLFAALSVLGDLTESALKRDAKLKDSASLIPGHGGMLDMVDALLFCLPAGFYYIYFKQIAGFSI